MPSERPPRGLHLLEPSRRFDGRLPIEPVRIRMVRDFVHSRVSLRSIGKMYRWPVALQEEVLRVRLLELEAMAFRRAA